MSYADAHRVIVSAVALVDKARLQLKQVDQRRGVGRKHQTELRLCAFAEPSLVEQPYHDSARLWSTRKTLFRGAVLPPALQRLLPLDRTYPQMITV